MATVAVATTAAARVFYETSHPFRSRTTRSTRKPYVFLLKTRFSKSDSTPDVYVEDFPIDFIFYTRAFLKSQADQIPKTANSALWTMKITDVINMYATSETKFHVRSRGNGGIPRWSSLVCLLKINGRESGVLDGLWRFD